ncbi:N-6 DNA methylase [Alishewanella sp. 16-MA]|uniref:site-specific DNA-methyltransferase (adenine-specific) n=1 Tax=Alishewanella maricola TaxID=2795740 RepID=A0ABS8C5V1_9ALTE|nr:N-6 DNA methylase [Alishewanella maricola]MCB5227708.1 N-6 DNA methylase [Alishewanella maricola]
MARTKKADQPMTTAQQLGAIVKSSRKIMRKDKGLNGDLDRLPMLTWIMFLKFLDDLEQMRETEAVLEGKSFQPAIEAPYRWRDWAATEGGITGDELIAFINNDEAMRPDGTRGIGLFAYLRSLQGNNGGDRRDVIATVFKGLQNRMINGYLLRDVIDKINGIHFNSSEEMHTLSRLYETMLREMRDAAGDSGEFYTPRPVVRFMVEVMNPQLGESVLDPACGTGGFLVEAFEHLERQCKTVEDREVLQEKSIFGGEAKSLPYLLVQMNLLLHGLEYPRIDSENSLRFPLREIGDKDRVDVILSNPPFGGEEEKGILGNFPEDMQTAETVQLFLQLIMRKLKRKVNGSESGGRAAVVVPESVLYDGGVAQRVRKQLLSDFNLHTVIRLPKGVFEPYSDIQSNILFFDRNGPTQGVWFYQHEVPAERRGMKNPCYTVTNALKEEEMAEIRVWYESPCESEYSWFVPFEDIERKDFSFDFRNPRKEQKELKGPEHLQQALSSYLSEIEGSNAHLQAQFETIRNIDKKSWNEFKIGDFLIRSKNSIELEDDVDYKQITVKLYGKGAVLRQVILGKDIKTKSQFIAQSGQLIMSRIDARNGAFAIVPFDLDGAVVTQDFPLFDIRKDVILPEFLAFLLRSKEFTYACQHASKGTTNRKRLKEELFLGETLPLPSISEQKIIVDYNMKLNELANLVRDFSDCCNESTTQLADYFLNTNNKV